MNSYRNDNNLWVHHKCYTLLVVLLGEPLEEARDSLPTARIHHKMHRSDRYRGNADIEEVSQRRNSCRVKRLKSTKLLRRLHSKEIWKKTWIVCKQC